jgi:inner membrane protein
MEELSLLDRFNKWLSESIMIKLISIGILMLVLLIPSSFVEDLIYERQMRADGVVAEVASKWAGQQTLAGPVLVVPFRKTETVKEWTAGVEHSRLVETIHKAYFLATNLSIDGNVSPEVLHRGIFDVSVYDSKITLNASFGDLNFSKWNISDDQVIWGDAELVLGISDLQGIHEIPKIRSGNLSLESESTAHAGLAYGGSTGIVVPFDWKARGDMLKEFTIALDLKGSQQLYFIPAAQNTSVSVSGKWNSPSFDGKTLPTTREVTDSAFNATWKVLFFNRAFSDQWIDEDQSMTGTEFGVRLLIPADQYQKSMRTAKYEALIILLAFTALFLVEITRKVRIHPFQYILVGIALTIYYTLLLSISEHMGYNAAYAIASIATVLLLSLYSMTFLKTKGLVVLFSAVMAVFYVFIFVIIQAEDFSLLIGSIGLFLIISVAMYFSRNIKWYKEPATNEV